MGKEISWAQEADLSLENVLNYLEAEWSTRISESFYEETIARTHLILNYPDIGIQSLTIPMWRKILITKHNILVYRTDRDKITILNIIDTRSSNYTL
jgi:plasmid stabilization system protein ParE